MKGSVTVEVDDKRTSLGEDDTIYLPKGCKHRAINSDKPSIILEISLGEFEESDIVRIADIYNRV